MTVVWNPATGVVELHDRELCRQLAKLAADYAHETALPVMVRAAVSAAASSDATRCVEEQVAR